MAQTRQRGCCLCPIPPELGWKAAGAGFSHLSKPLDSTSGGHVAAGLGQPNPFPSPQRKGKGGVSLLRAAFSSDPGTAGQPVEAGDAALTLCR